MVVAKKKISNNLLSVLLGFAILTSIVGILASMNILSPLTGAATQVNATVNLTVTQDLSCKMDDTNINFSAPLVRNTGNASENEVDWHTLENDGNVNLTISAYTLEGKDLWETISVADAAFQYRCNGTESGTCTQATYANVAFSSGAAVELLDGLESDDGIDLASFGVNVTVPNDEPAGIKGSTITYLCVAA